MKSLEEIKQRRAEASRRWYENNQDKVRESRRRWQKNNPEKHAAAVMRWQKRNPDRMRARRRKTLYGLSDANFIAMRDVQCGCCAICKKETSKLCVDHDHVTGRVRSLLCIKCNSGLGLFKENADLLFRAADYLLRGGHSV